MHQFLKIDRLRVNLSVLQVWALLLNILEPILRHFEVGLGVPMDIKSQSANDHEDEGESVYKNAIKGSILQCQEELEELLIEDEAW